MLVWNVHALEWLHSEMSFKCLNAAETGCINEYLRQLCCAIWVVADRWRFKEGIGFGNGERMAFFWTIEKFVLDIRSMREAKLLLSTSPSLSRRKAFKCTPVGPLHKRMSKYQKINSWPDCISTPL